MGKFLLCFHMLGSLFSRDSPLHLKHECSCQEGKGLAVLCEIRERKQLKITMSGEAVCVVVLCCSRSCSAAFQKRGRFHAFKGGT